MGFRDFSGTRMNQDLRVANLGNWETASWETGIEHYSKLTLPRSEYVCQLLHNAVLTPWRPGQSWT